MKKHIVWALGVSVFASMSFFLLTNQQATAPSSTRKKGGGSLQQFLEPRSSGGAITLFQDSSEKSSILIDATPETSIGYQSDLPDTASIRINGAQFTVEVADSPDIQMEGLTGRTSISNNSGMLYVLTAPVQYKYWAKDMLFATDVVWIGPDRVIKDIFENITPESYPKQFVSEHATQYVLEFAAGTVKQYGIEIGVPVDLSELDRKP